MTSREFCYWLMGFFEISGADITKKLTEKQVELVKRHLNMVFKHEIDPSQGSPEHQTILNEVHSGQGQSQPAPQSVTGLNPIGAPSGHGMSTAPMIRC